MTWCSRKQVTRGPHIPGQLNLVATIQARPDYPYRVGFPSRGLLVDMQQVAPPSNRPVCNEVQQQVNSIFSTSFRISSLESKCTQSAMGGPGPGWPNMP